MSRLDPAARSFAAVLGVVTVLVVGGCGDTGPSPVTTQPTWPASTDPLDTDGVIWAAGSSVHLADGTVIDTADPVEGFVVAGDDVFFTTDQPADRRAAIAATPLYAADRDGSVRQVADGVAAPLASPDGRYLVFLDAVSSDAHDDFGATQVESVVVDLRTGEEVTRSPEGMGDPGADDFAQVYGDAEIAVHRVTEETAYVGGTDGDYAVDLATGTTTRLDPADRSWDRRPGDPTSPDGRWRIVDSAVLRDRLVSRDGERLLPRTGTTRWDLDHWTDDGVAVGFAIEGPGGGRGAQVADGDAFALMGCTVPSGACEVIDASLGRTIRFPNGEADFESTTLPAGR